MITRATIVLLLMAVMLVGCRKTAQQQGGVPPVGSGPSVALAPEPEGPPASQPDEEMLTPAAEQADPVTVVQVVFDAARSEEFSRLGALCDPEGESDEIAQDICALASDDGSADLFIENFASGRVNGEATLSEDGTQARVPILYGPDGDEETAITLIRREGEWYLYRF